MNVVETVTCFQFNYQNVFDHEIREILADDDIVTYDVERLLDLDLETEFSKFVSESF